MADEDEQKRGKRGRPSQGGPGEQVRVPRPTLKQIDAYAQKHRCSRQEAMVKLVAKGAKDD
jgi:hypothetical protein